MQRVFLVLVPALWVAAIAIISVQNATPVSVTFLNFRSVELPIGVVLGFCVAGGMVLTAIVLGLLSATKAKKR